MSWLQTGINLFKTAKTFIDPISKFLKKEGDYEDLRMSQEGESGGFLSKQAANRFGLPPLSQSADVTLLQRGLGRTRQGITDIEKLLAPINKLQANGYDALANALIQKAIREANIISSRDLMPESTSHPDSQNIKLGDTT